MPNRRRSTPPPAHEHTRFKNIAFRALVIVVAGFAAYANSLSGPFVFDDQSSVIENTAIRSVATLMAEPRNTPLAGRPMAALTIAANYAAGGVDVRVYHLTNIVIHLGCALLMFGIIRRTLELPQLAAAFEHGALDLSFAAALLWTLHPLNTEAVDYITQRTESLMAFFYLLTLYAALRAFTATRGAAWRRLAVAACALGMASKESMVTAPVMVLLYDRTFLFASFKEALRARWRLYIGLALGWLLLAYLMWPGPRARTIGFVTGVSPWTYLLNQAMMIARYLRLTFWPSGLVMAYGPPLPLTLGDAWPQALLIVFLVILTVAALVWRPTLAFLGAWVFVVLAPTSTIVPIATEVGAERRMYLPLMAIITLATIGVQYSRAARQRIPGGAWTFALAVLAIALGARTVARNHDYSSSVLLAQSVVRYWPSDAAHSFLGGELAAAGRADEAIPELRLGARVDPRARYNLGLALFNQGRYDEAIHELQRLATEYARSEEAPLARRLAGQAFALQQQWREAIDQLRMALSTLPDDADTKTLLVDALNHDGGDLAEHGRFNAAVAAFREAAHIDPGNASVRQNLAAALLAGHDAAAAAQEAAAAIAIAPTDAEAYALLGRALALQGKLTEAARQLEHALVLAPGDEQLREDSRQVQAGQSRRRQSPH